MSRSKNVVSAPKPPDSAFNKDRPVSSLLRTQAEHLAAVVKKDIDQELKAIKTEGEASAFITKMTAILRS